MSYKKLTVKDMQTRISSGKYKSRTGALRAIGKLKVSNKDKEKLRKEAVKLPSVIEDVEEVKHKIQNRVYKSHRSAKEAIRRMKVNRRTKKILYGKAHWCYKGSADATATPAPETTHISAPILAPTPPMPVIEAFNSPNFLIQFVRVARNKEQTKRLLQLLNGAAEFGLTLPQLLEALEAA